jgi:short-subunit dehydrogenase involved in D-alanine esterification of teichoic acids
MSGFPYKKVLVVGATSGIGWALAERMVQHKIHVILVGRRKERLEEFQQKHGGSDKVSTAVFDITNLDGINDFASSITESHPDLDCVFLNAGIQRGMNFGKPESIDFKVIGEEFTTNYLSYLRLTTAFLPFLQSKKDQQTAIIYTTSGLALVPLLRCPNYSATKAALHHMILCIRVQVAQEGRGNVKIIELGPPAVQTELHDEDKQPDIKNGRSLGMPIDEFTDEAWEGLSKGEEQVWVGELCKGSLGWEMQRQERFRMMVKRMQS